jgi:hypothetical protein
MSHFSVLVIGGDIEKQLAPFHEFECTGLDDEHVQEIDVTEKALAKFNEDTSTRYRDSAGNLHEAFDEAGDYKPEYLREPTPEELAKHGKMIGSGSDGKIRWVSSDWYDGKGYRAKVFQIPEGLVEVEVRRNTVETFAEFCSEYYGHPVVPFGTEPDLSGECQYGYTIVDEKGEVVKTVDRTNPNAKWDWYEIGGRWNGYFKLKSLAVGVLGQPGLQTMNKDYEPPTNDRADSCFKSDIDIEGMRDEESAEAAKRYDLFTEVTAGQSHLSWEQVKEKHPTGDVDTNGKPEVNWEAAREEYNAQPTVTALRSNDNTRWFDADDFLCPREQYIQRFRDSACVTFAVVKDGQWYERGQMGWFGMTRNEKDRDEWNAQFAALLDGLSDNTLITIVDCHI